jgi:hypothetical protein
VWRYYIFSALKSAYPEKTRHICGDATPSLPVLNRISSQPTPHQPLAPIMVNESTNAGNIEILREIFEKQYRLRPENHCFRENLFLVYGDQKTVARLRSIKRLRQNSRRAYDRLDWLLPVFGLWHLKFNFLQLIHQIHWSSDDYTDKSTLSTAASRLGRKDVNTAKDFKKLEQLVTHAFHAHVVSYVIQHLHRLGLVAQASRTIQPSLLEEGLENYLDQLDQQSFSALLDTIYQQINDDLSVESPTSAPLFLRHGLYYLLLKDSIKHGDIYLLKHAISILCVLFSGASNRFNYTQELFHYFHLTASNASDPILQTAVLRNSLVNTQGNPDSHYEKDRRLEHHNKMMKEIRLQKRTSSFPMTDLIRQCSLLAPQYECLDRHLQKTFTGRINEGHHPRKSSDEDIRSLALFLSVYYLSSSKLAVGKPLNLLAVGCEQLEVKVQAFNHRHRDILTDDLEQPLHSMSIDESGPYRYGKLHPVFS